MRAHGVFYIMVERGIFRVGYVLNAEKILRLAYTVGGEHRLTVLFIYYEILVG